MTAPLHFHLSHRSRVWLLILAGLLLLLLNTQQAMANDERSIRLFRDEIVSLGPTVNPAEAQMVSETSYNTASKYRKEWRVFPSAIFNNFLIHVGARQRGYCFHWAHAIGAELRKLPLKTLELHWAEAYPGGQLEHNVVVVTLPGQPIRTGYIIDGWRAAGRLFWWPVAKDEYPWKENPTHTAWLQHRGPDPLPGLDEAVTKEGTPSKTNRRVVGTL
jgi:hypothetical protein